LFTVKITEEVKELNGVSAHGDDVALSGHTVVAEGCYGTVIWTVCSELYARLPRNKRDQLLSGTVDRVINPYLVGLVGRLLAQAGCEGTSTEMLATEWSLEDRRVSCTFGAVDWQISQGLWDAIPEDQREALYATADMLLHDFFGDDVYVPLMRYAIKQMRG
jgi:hypothetical protein